nr:hypothetical protein [uncultured Flavobacterium sp.]
MKKKLEAELISIAHRILQLKHKEDVIQLHQEAQKLYEKLSILRFYEENFEALKPTLTHEELDEKIEAVYGEKKETIAEVSEEVSKAEVPQEEVSKAEVPQETTPVDHTMDEIPVEDEKILVGLVDIDESEIEEDEEEEEPVVSAEEPQPEEIIEPVFERAHEEISQEETEIIEEKAIEEESKVIEEKELKPKQISFADLLGDSYKEPDFVKVNHVPAEVEKAAESTFEKVEEPVAEVPKEEIVVAEPKAEKSKETQKKEVVFEKTEFKAMSLNDKFNKTITLSLNDRIAFEKHLFGGSGEDLNRVLSQLNTFNSLEEAKSFIDDLVKPDYNGWDGKEEFSSRFMELVEKKFA